MTGSVDISALQNGQIINTASGSGTLDSFVIGSITPKAATFTTLGITNGAIAIGGNLTVSGSFTTTMTVTGNTSVTLPTSGTLTTLPTVVSTANTFSAAQRGSRVTLTDGATITPDFSLGNSYVVTLGGNRTLGVPTNLGASQSGDILVWQDITGSRTLAYAWPYKFIGNNAPALSTGKLAEDQLVFKVNFYGTSTVTMTIAAPGVVTWTSHGLISGMKVQFTTTGALPTGVTASTTYWVTVVDANTFKLSTTLANAQAATFITTSGSQSGTHTAVSAEILVSANVGWQ